MGEDELEETMTRFVNQEVDVLVCTTIIESGLDIPTANTIIIHNADRFGLAELHQLRGRVGRYKHRAYCYLLLPDTRTVSPTAAKRLKAVEEFSDLGAGFQIAMRDLEIRGAGNILGMEQSGHIAAVGYELYCQLLEQSVAALRGQKVPRPVTVNVQIGIDLYIPKTFVPSDRQRMEIYRRMVRCHSAQDLGQLRSDLADAYGPVPPPVATMLDEAEIRVLAAAAGIESIIRMEADVVFAIRDFAAAKAVFNNAPGTVRLPDDRTVYWRPPPEYLQLPELVNVLLTRLRQSR
jgi:transcription-repair coupling factor (superfamily II helicase)